MMPILDTGEAIIRVQPFTYQGWLIAASRPPKSYACANVLQLDVVVDDERFFLADLLPGAVTFNYSEPLTRRAHSRVPSRNGVRKQLHLSLSPGDASFLLKSVGEKIRIRGHEIVVVFTHADGECKAFARAHPDVPNLLAVPHGDPFRKWITETYSREKGQECWYVEVEHLEIENFFQRIKQFFQPHKEVAMGHAGAAAAGFAAAGTASAKEAHKAMEDLPHRAMAEALAKHAKQSGLGVMGQRLGVDTIRPKEGGK